MRCCWKGGLSPTLVMQYILGVLESLLKLPRQQSVRRSLDAVITMLCVKVRRKNSEAGGLDGTHVLCPQHHAGLDERPRLRGTRLG